MAINIDQLTEAELIDLNRCIVKRLQFLYQMRAHATMLQFAIDDRVTFATDDGPIVVSVLVRYNKKRLSSSGSALMMILGRTQPEKSENTPFLIYFSNWKSHNAYQQAFDRLLRDLKLALERKPERS